MPWLQGCLLSLLAQGLARSQPLPPQRCNQRSKTWRLCCPAAPLHPPMLQGTGTRRAEGSWLPQASESHLDCLVRSAVEIVLRSHQCSHPVIETCQLLLQFELSTYDIPDLWRHRRTHGHSGTGRLWGSPAQPLAPASTRPAQLTTALLPGGNRLTPLTGR